MAGRTGRSRGRRCISATPGSCSNAREGCASPAQHGHHGQSLTVFVDDVDAHVDHARSAGAKIVENLNETVYGERQYGVEALEGHLWLFSRHVRDVSPDAWGATVSDRGGALLGGDREP